MKIPWTSLLLPLLVGSSHCGAADVAPSQPLLGLNQVSVLLPLPKPSELPLLLQPTDRGAHGELLPSFALPAPALVQNEDRATTIANLRLIGIRIDPCYPNLFTTQLASCQRTLHLVWQPLVPSDGNTLTTADAAIHTLHRLSDSDFQQFLDSYLQLDAPFPVDRTLPLGVHPQIAQQTLGGSYWRALRQLLLRSVGADNLDRMTYFAVRAVISEKYQGQGWLLSGAEFNGGQISLVAVATTSDSEQHFGNNTAPGPKLDTVDSFVGDFIPRTRFSDALLPIVGDSAQAATAPLSDIQAAVEVALQIEDPRRNTLDTVDCVSCHVATPARIWAQQHRQIDSSKSPNRYTNPSFDLSLRSETSNRTNSLRGFGYYESLVAISQRTVNDTAADAEFINQNLLRSH
jgi:hypothetical protein